MKVNSICILDFEDLILKLGWMYHVLWEPFEMGIKIFLEFES